MRVTVPVEKTECRRPGVRRPWLSLAKIYRSSLVGLAASLLAGTVFAVSPAHAALDPDTGVVWTQGTGVTDSGNVFKDVAYGNGMFVAVSSSGNDRVHTSTDGSTWTPQSGAPGHIFNSVAYGNGVFVAVANSNNTAWSADGVTWNSVSSSGAASASWSTIAFDGTQFLAFSANSSSEAITTTDGTSWTASASISAGDDWASSAGHAGTVVAGNLNTGSSDADQFLITSDGGSTWSTSPRPGGQNRGRVYALGYGNGLFMAAPDSTDDIYTSSDGTTWAAAGTPLGTNYRWRDFAYGEGLWVGVSAGGVPIQTSSDDGATWASRSHPLSSRDVRAVAFGNCVFVAVIDFATANGVISSGTAGSCNGGGGGGGNSVDVSQWPTAPMQSFATSTALTSEQCGEIALADGETMIIDWQAFPEQRATGWKPSWAQWPNNGTGGFVCTRQPYWTGSAWALR